MSSRLRTFRAAVIAAMLAVFGVACGVGQQGVPTGAPKLVVLLVVDQMRADYVERFRKDWTGGLKRLLTTGAWFSNAAYPYLTTVTCAGHSTIATGAFPSLHGIIQNSWYDRELRRRVTCTEDAAVAGVGYGIDVTSGDSAARLLVPTFAEEMRRQRGGRTVALSLKPTSAIMLAGHEAEVTTWLSTSQMGWQTSSAYSAHPVPEVRTYLESHPIQADYGQVWSPLLPETHYSSIDGGNGEAPPRGWTSLFPHPLSSSTGRPDGTFYALWKSSPFADAYLGRFAAALAETMQLGTRRGTDVLAISFSTPDLVGHAFGPGSREVQDVYARLDQTIGLLLDRLDALVGSGQYLVALSADHGVTPFPDQGVGRGGGRVATALLAALIDKVAQASLGPGRYVTTVNGNDVYFEPGVYKKLTEDGAALMAVREALEKEPGIARTFTRDQLADAATSSDRLVRAAALSYVPSRSGDLIFALKEGWSISVPGTTHGTANPDDQRVPIILSGPGIRPGERGEAVTPADIAPTLAALTGITMTESEGTVLSAAIQP